MNWRFASDANQALPRFNPIDDITPEWAWGGSTGRGVKVAIIDSGIDALHPAVGSVRGYAAIVQGRDGLDVDTSPHDDSYGHGTACAGIIRAAAPDCELFSVRVLGPRLLGEGAVFIAALRWSIENEMHICNLSLGTTKKEFFAPLHELTDLAYYRNIMLVTAANNMPILSFPSTYASVFSVASHDQPGSSQFFYNPRPPAEFGAPGMEISVPWQKGSWITATGNSFAAAYMSGLITRILGKHPGLTAFQMKSVLRALAANVETAGSVPRVAMPHSDFGDRN
jgi:subtilisin